jgi:hypothetical protein
MKGSEAERAKIATPWKKRIKNQKTKHRKKQLKKEQKNRLVEAKGCGCP